MSTEYASLEVERVILHPVSAGVFADADAVPKSYVDTADVSVRSYVDTKISDLIGGAGAAYDTLKELETALSVSGGSLSAEILAKVSEEKNERINADVVLDGKITTEATRAQNAEGDLNSRLLSAESSITLENERAVGAETALDAKVSDEAAARGAAFVSEAAARNAAIANEQARAEGVEQALDAAVQSHSTSIFMNSQSISQATEDRAELHMTKYDKTGGDITGNVKLVDSYLNFGENWRVKGSADGRRLHFEYSRDGVTWKIALPFISAN